MSENNLRKKLRDRRRLLNTSAQENTQSLTESNVTRNDIDSPQSETTLKNEKEDGSDLRSTITRRREKSRTFLDNQERQHSALQASHTNETLRSDENLSDKVLSDSENPPSLASTDRQGSKTDFDSRSSTPYGKRTLGYSALRSRFKTLHSKQTGKDLDDVRRLKDRVSRSNRFLLSTTKLDDKNFESQIEDKLREKRAKDEAKSHRGEPTEEECYDFFTKQYEDVPSEDESPAPAPAPAPASAESAQAQPDQESPAAAPAESIPAEEGRAPETRDDVAEEPQVPPAQSSQDDVARQASSGTVSQPQPENSGDEVTEQQKQLLDDILADQLDWQLFNVFAAEYRSYNSQLTIENSTYHVPSKLPPDARSKIPDDASPRYLEEEGIFVGDKPAILPTNINILENRLLKEPEFDRAWFGLDGRVEILPNPLKTIITKSWVENELNIDENLHTYYSKAKIPGTEEKYLENSDNNELQIDIGSISFLHHPLMSREHVLCSNIQQLYDEYIEMRHKNFVLFFADKLVALRNAVNDLRGQSFFNANPDDVSSQENHVVDYLVEIRRTTRQLNSAEARERDLMRKIIEEWKQIKLLREQQKYTNTTVKLTIKKEEVNRDEDRERWQKEVELELNERKEEYQISVVEPYEENLSKFKAQLEKWKRSRAKLQEERKSSSGENLLDPNQDGDDGAEITIAGNIDKPEPPDKPDDFDEEVTRVDIMNTLLANRRNPGEDKISLQLSFTGSISSLSEVPPAEASRRKAVQKSAILLKVRFNGREVFVTDSRSLSTDFKLYFGIIFRIRIVQWPESLKIQFLDAGLVVNSMFSEVFLRIPDTTVHAGNAQLRAVDFSSEQKVSFDHTAVGSNNPFQLKQADAVPTSNRTHGQLICSVSWGLDDEGQVLAPKGASAIDPLSNLKKVDPVSALGAEAVLDPKTVSKWVHDNRIDPNDPENASLVPFMHDTEGHSLPQALDYFRLEQLQQEFNFITDEEFNEMNRLRLLSLRNEEVVEFRNLAMIPCREHEIMDSAFTTYEKRLKEKASVMGGQNFVESGTLSTHRLQVLQYREQVKEQVLQRFFAARHYRTYDDVIREDQVPDVRTLAEAIGRWSQVQRPLKPARKARKKATGQSLTDGSVNILVTVVRGNQIPTRQETHTSSHHNLNASLSHSARFGAGGLSATQQPALVNSDVATKTHSVAPFVAVSFQDNVVTTQVSQGPCPSWNEELKLPFSAPNNDYSPGNLQIIDDIIFVHLFDRVVEEVPPAFGETDSSRITHKISNHWLGTFRLPFSTLYQRGNIDGTFRLKVPPVLLGYDKEVLPSSDLRDQFDYQFSRTVEGTFLTLFITLDPILRPTDPIKDRFESKEDESLIDQCADFLALCHKKYPQRYVLTTVVNLKGESVLITRYVKPLQPPEELTEGSDLGSMNVAERIARFVSFIPFTSDNVTYAGVCDLWSACDQFLHMLQGDEEEHAVLLLNFFLHLGKKAFLLLGTAIPEGNSAYVLVFGDALNDIKIWNASTGECYDYRNTLSPLRSIGALANAENIWFNLQSHDVPWKVRFDITRKSDWKPLFAPNTPALSSIQPDVLFYIKTDENYVAKLTQTITDLLKDKIMSWRPRHVTRWNRACNFVLFDVLKNLEAKYERRGTVLSEIDHAEEIKSKVGNVKFTGFPMDMPYTGEDAIITAVRSTELHKIQDPDVEFSLAVYIHPYPASVLVVWVYIAALINRRRGEL